MTDDHLPDVGSISDEIHHALPERSEVLVEKRRLFPEGAFVLSVGAEVAGYAISHPWIGGEVPLLDTFLDSLPSAADALHLHDIAILPRARGHKSARALVELLWRIAGRHGLRSLTLVSVYGTHALWARLGFEEVSIPKLSAVLRSYGGNPRYMISRAGFVGAIIEPF